MAIRKASKAQFPYGPPGHELVSYFFLTDEDGDAAIVQLRSTEEVEQAINDKETIYAAWPGKSRTDLFIIDDTALLLAELDEPS